MKARNFSNVRHSLATMAIALGSALAIAACAGSNGGDTGTGGSTGKGGASAKGGTSGGGSGGTSTQAGGSGGTSTEPTGGTTGNPPAGNTVATFANGKASGALTGYGWIALGAYDSASSPTCKDPSGTDPRPITKASACPSCGGKSIWNSEKPESLCISGSIPKVTKGDAGTDDYDNNWGVQIGVNVGPVDGCADAGATVVAPKLGDPNNLGDKAGAVTKITFTVSPGAVTPATAVVRGQIHRAGDDENTNYCATILVTASGTPSPILLTSFNTKCWGDPTTVFLKAEDVPNIDKIGVQISSDNVSAYTVKDFCLSKIEFTAE